MALIATATMQSWLGISVDEAILETILLPGVISLVERHSGRLYTSPAGEVTEILDGGNAVRGADVLIGSDRAAALSFVTLKEKPNGALTSVSFRPSIGDAWEVKTLSDFEVDGRNVYALAADFPRGRRNVRIVYTFGYAEDAAPADAHLLMLEMVKAQYEQRGADSTLKRLKVPGVDLTWQDCGKQAADFKRRAALLRRPSLVF